MCFLSGGARGCGSGGLLYNEHKRRHTPRLDRVKVYADLSMSVSMSMSELGTWAQARGHRLLNKDIKELLRFNSDPHSDGSGNANLSFTFSLRLVKDFEID